MQDNMNEFAKTAKMLTDGVAKKFEEACRISKLKLQVLNLSRFIRMQKAVLGQRVYEMYKSGKEDNEELLSRTNEIDRAMERLKLLEKKISGLSNFISCPVCGAKSRTKAAYCSSCGHKLMTTDEQFDVYDTMNNVSEDEMY